MALTDRKKTIAIVASILVIGVVIASAIAVSFSLIAVKQSKTTTTTLYEPSAESLYNTQLDLSPKFLDNGDERAEEGHYTFVLEDTDISTFESVQAEIQKKSSNRWEITGNYSAVGIFSVKMDESSLKAIAMPLEAVQKHVLYIEPVYKVKLARATSLWGLDRLDQTNFPLNSNYDVPNNYNGAGVNVYVLDTGIRATHTEIAGRVMTGFDTIGDGQGTNDCHGHGTHVAGTVAGTTYGVANGANLYPVRVLNCQGSGTGQQVLNGINWVASNAKKPAVASMSLGGGYYAAENTAVERAIASGVSFVVAAGNENQDAANVSPASTANAITVGATTSTDARASYSNWGTKLDIFAPGSSIKSCGITSDTASATMSGTSMATPHVSGVVALYLQKFPTATPAQVTQAIINGAKDGKVTDTQNSPNKLLDVQFLKTTASSAASSASTSAASSAASSASTSASTSAASSAAPIATSAPVVPPITSVVTETGSLSGRGYLNYHPRAPGFTITSTATLTATLTGPTSSSTDFDLALLKFNPNSNTWSVVASGNSARSSEAITTVQNAGSYIWRVSSYKGKGSYSITYKRA